ncbi:MAG TPA: diiron oxygenase [Methylomirabilota bacterium]|nr:diiron oxygenase [Methylomirabilota bacterium]
MTAYTYEGVLATSQRVNWKIDDIIGDDKHLDFDRSFMPESLAGVRKLDFLSPDEQRTLNQIRGLGYLVMFGLVEEYILPFVLDHARPRLAGDDYRTRALIQFASEEAKHIQLFKRFREEFDAGFGHHCEVIGPPEAVAAKILSYSPLAVALLTLHIEWFVQAHYLDSIKDDQALDPQFKSLLKHHWMEEAQHTKLDTLMVEELAAAAEPEDIAKAVDEYLEIGAFIDGGMQQQVKMDLDSFEQATGHRLNAEERERFCEAQLKALRWTFIGSGITHPNFLATVGKLSPRLREKLEAVGPAFC